MSRPEGTTAAVISDDLASFVGGGVAVVLATRNAQLRPQISRAWGAQVSEDRAHVVMCVDAGPDAELMPGAPISVTVSLPSNYRTVQLKGTIDACAEPTPEDEARVQSHAASFEATTATVGLTGGRRLVRTGLVAITVAVREVYHQTPGPGAGARL